MKKQKYKNFCNKSNSKNILMQIKNIKSTSQNAQEPL